MYGLWAAPIMGCRRIYNIQLDRRNIHYELTFLRGQGLVANRRACISSVSAGLMLKLSISKPPQLQVLEQDLTDSITNLKDKNRIFGTPLSINELLDPLEQQENLDMDAEMFKDDVEIAEVRRREAVRNGDAIEVDSDDEDDCHGVAAMATSELIALAEKLEAGSDWAAPYNKVRTLQIRGASVVSSLVRTEWLSPSDGSQDVTVLVHVLPGLVDTRELVLAETARFLMTVPMSGHGDIPLRRFRSGFVCYSPQWAIPPSASLDEHNFRSHSAKFIHMIWSSHLFEMYAWPPFLSGLPDLDLLEGLSGLHGARGNPGTSTQAQYWSPPHDPPTRYPNDPVKFVCIHGNRILITQVPSSSPYPRSSYATHGFVRQDNGPGPGAVTSAPLPQSFQPGGTYFYPAVMNTFPRSTGRAGQDAFADTGMLPNNNAPHSSSLHRARVPQEMRGDHLRLSQAGEMGQPRRDMRVSQVHDVASGNQSWDQAEATGFVPLQPGPLRPSQLVSLPSPAPSRAKPRDTKASSYTQLPDLGSTEDGEDDEGEEEDSTFLYASLRRQDIHESTSQPLP
ncbi:hypothetical protein BU15DRAFT_66536 [Melanogaster broomeanus]|nr:hypothetical protein BU15DRAFT_66536 [Melanogaster broomeanus]